MKTVGVTDYQTLSILDGKKCLKFNIPKNEKIFMKCAQNKRCTSSMCEQSLYKVRKHLELQITQTRHHKSVADGWTDRVDTLLDIQLGDIGN